MIRVIWFIFRLAVLSAIVAWAIEHQGTVNIDWQGYEVETSTGVLLFLIAFVVIVFALMYRFYRAFISVPKMVRNYNKVQSREKGYLAITKGLAAVAAGDKISAQRHANRAKKLLPSASMTGLLTAQAALLNNNKDVAKLEFENLLDDNNAAFFGIRGLINLAAKDQDNNQLVSLMQKAESIAPKQPWVIEYLFEFQACNAEWEKAEQTLAKAIRLGAINRQDGNKHRQAILLARAYEADKQGVLHSALAFAKKSYLIDQTFIPAVTAYACFLKESNKWRLAVKIIEKAWLSNQHPDLIDVWKSLILPVKGKNISEDDRRKHAYQWSYRLYKIAPFGKTSNDMMGKASMDVEKWNEARDFLKTAGSYRILAKLELKSGNDEIKAREWLEMATDSHEHTSWVCRACGYTDAKWQPLCGSCGLFNSVSWTVPQPGTYGYGALTHNIHDENTILESPSVA